MAKSKYKYIPQAGFGMGTSAGAAAPTTKNPFANLSNDDKSDLIDEGAGIATSALGLLTDKGQYKGGETGNVIGKTLGGVGGFLLGGPAGAKIGSQVLGTIGSLIGGNQDKQRQADDIASRQQKQYANFNMGINLDPYGNQYEEGGMTAPDAGVGGGDPGTDTQAMQQQQPAPTRQINVEQGEIMIDPNTFKVVRKFTNPNRYSAHKKKQFEEPMGNFVNVPQGMVIIPKKLAPRYERGDDLTKKSIVMQILTDQSNDPMHNVPEEAKPAGYDPDQDANNPNMMAQDADSDQDTPQAGKGGRFMGINPAHKGYCTPMTKSTCTPARKRLAKTLKKHHGFHEDGGKVFGWGGMTNTGTPLLTAMNPKGGQLLHGFPEQQPLVGAPEIYPTPDGLPPAPVANITQGAFGPAPQADPILDMTKAPDTGAFSSKLLNKLGVTPPVAPTTNTGSKTNWGMAGRKALQDLPIFAQMATAMQGDPYLTHNPNIGYDGAISDAMQMPEDVSIAGNLADNDRSFATAIRGVDNSSSPSARAEKSQLLATKFQGDNAAFSAKNSAGTQLKASKLTTLLGLKVQQGASNAADNAQYNLTASQDQAARENMFNAGLVNYAHNNAEAQNDSERIKALNTMLHSIQIDPLAQKLFADNPGFSNYALSVMMDGKTSVSDAYDKWMRDKRDNETKTFKINKVDKSGNVSTVSGQTTKVKQ